MNHIYDESLFSEKPITQNITISNLKKLYPGNNRYKHAVSFISRRKETSVSNKYAKVLHIKNHGLTRSLKTLSSGNQKKVLLAKSLFTEANIFLLNDPASQIDIASKVDVYNILNGLIKQGAGIILTSSNLSELVGMCDVIYVIKKGRIAKKHFYNDSVHDVIASLI